MSAMQRRKGATFERELARYLTEHGVDARRGIGQARSASEVPDVEVDGYWIEAKRQIKPNIRAALEQADKAASEAHALGGVVAVAVCRSNGDSMQRATVTLYLDDWIELVKAKRDLDMVCARASAAEAEKAGGDDVATWNEVLP